MTDHLYLKDYSSLRITFNEKLFYDTMSSDIYNKNKKNTSCMSEINELCQIILFSHTINVT